MRSNFHEINGNHSGGGLYSQQQLKIKRDSHVIKKPTSSSPVSAAAAAAAVSPSKPRQPVIIYAHTPKIIHTDEKDFKALVQKLTGMPGSGEDLAPTTPPHTDNRENSTNSSPEGSAEEIEKNNLILGNNHNVIGAHSKSSSVATIDAKIEELGQTNYSMFAHPPPPAPAPPPLPPPLPIFDPSENQPYLSTPPLFASNPADNLLYGNQSFLDFDADSSIFETDLRSTFSSSEFGGLLDFCEL